jgi:hypothetical protein
MSLQEQIKTMSKNRNQKEGLISAKKTKVLNFYFFGISGVIASLLYLSFGQIIWWQKSFFVGCFFLVAMMIRCFVYIVTREYDIFFWNIDIYENYDELTDFYVGAIADSEEINVTYKHLLAEILSKNKRLTYGDLRKIDKSEISNENENWCLDQPGKIRLLKFI